MNPHPSDLTLERLLRGESSALHARVHVSECTHCWRRWTALHIHEGLAPPEALAPRQHRRCMPWLVTAAAAVIALAAIGLDDSSPTTEELATLKGEIEELQQKLSEASRRAAPPRPPSVTPAPRRPLPTDEARGVDGPTSVSSRPGLIPAVSPEAIQEAAYGLRDTADQFVVALYTGVAAANAH